MKSRLNTVLEYNFMYCIGSTAYSAAEIAYRGHTHWTMVLTGGICAAVIYGISKKTTRLSLPVRALICTGAVTVIEFAVGCVVNLIMKWNVWDYSGIPFNILGQVCPSFSLVWFLLCIPTVKLSDTVSSKFSDTLFRRFPDGSGKPMQ